MGTEITFIFGLHSHQPVGNFDHIFEEAYKKAYHPFLEVLYDYPDIPFVLHNSGVLWDWFEEGHPEYVETLSEMVARGQVEIMSGGYYEPILSVIPSRDRLGQLATMRDYLRRRFKYNPRGCWLTERIWEPHLPKTLADAGIEYVVVDDAHFKSTGFRSEAMRGFFLTEEDGAYVRVFPIDKKLRYLVPFRDPEETIAYFREIAREESDFHKIVVLADDGEKFGLWTGTHSLCYKKKWLHRFCNLLRNNKDWIELSTFSSIIDQFPAIGIAYLPTASYSEMMEWALPLRAQLQYQEAERLLDSSGRFSVPGELVRGGFWRNFLVKYEESNWMHKRMLLLSDAVEEHRKKGRSKKIRRDATIHLYQAQCNCAYWHGLFGGLYLPHLRSAIYKHLIEAESLLDKETHGRGPFLSHVVGDIDGDGIQEMLVSTRALRAYFKLRGGTLRELDLRAPAINLTDTLTRREEIFHQDIISRSSAARESIEEAISIHNVSSAKEEDLERYLVYDFHPRSSLLDHFIGDGVTMDSFSKASYRELGDFLQGVYEMRVGRSGNNKSFVFERNGKVVLPGGTVTVRVTKTVLISPASPDIEVRYTVTPLDRGLTCRFAVENIFSLLAGNAPDRYYAFPDRRIKESFLASAGEEEGVGCLSLVDEWLNIAINLEFEPETCCWRFPIETVSNSESGFERVYQGSVVVPVWSLELVKGESRKLSIGISISRVRD